MLEWLTSLLKETVEWQAWGWNLPTYGAIGATGLALFQGIGVWRQGKLVHREQDAHTLSFLLFGYSLSYFLSASVYGAKKMSLALMLLVLNGFLHIPVLTGIPKYGIVTKWEKWIAGMFLLMIPLMWLATKTGLHEMFFLVTLFGLLGFIGPQAYRAWKSDDTSDLNLTMILSFLFGAVFWFIYGVTVVDSWALKAFNPPAFVLWSFILVMWWKKGRVEEEKQDDPGDILMFIVYFLGGCVTVLVLGLAAGVAYLTGLI